MRILICYGRKPPYPPFGLHLVKGFQALGHSAALLGVRDRPLRLKVIKRISALRKIIPWDATAWSNAYLVQAVRRYKPDVVLNVGGDLFQPDTLGELKRRHGLRTAVWLVEGPFDRHLYPVLSAYDMITSTSTMAVRELQAMGFGQAAYLPFATDPEWFTTLRQESGRRHPLGFIGAYSPRRATFLEAASNLGLCLWGTDWGPTVQGTLRKNLRSSKGVFGKDLVRCYQTTKICLNIQREHMLYPASGGRLVGTGLGLRHFDVPACGSLLLSEWVEELPEALTVNEEVATFTTPDELYEKARYYLSHERAREIMVQRSRNRVLRDHTYRQRAQEWLTILATI